MRSPFTLERLEDRRLLAGDVTVSLLDGVRIVGDDAANSLTIEVANGNVVVTGRGGTTVNGSNQPVTVSAGSIGTSLNVSLGNGHDSLRVIGVEVSGATEIAMGLGDDDVTIDGATFGQSVVIGSGAGDDVVRVLTSTISGDLSIYTTTGDDSIQVTGSTVGGNLKIFSGDGDDVVNLAGGSVAGDVIVSGWYGNDGTLVESETIDGNVTLQARGSVAGNNFGNLPTDDNDFWDVDGNGTAELLKDGVLNIRYLAGFRGTVLVEGALGERATRTDPAEIVAYLDHVYALLASEPAHEPLDEGIATLRRLALHDNDGDDSANNTLQVLATDVGGNLTINTANGADTTVLQNTTVTGQTTADTGSGDDAFRADSLTANGFTAMTGTGRDLVAATGDSLFAGGVNILTGDDDDTLAIDDFTYFQMAAIFDGGPGSNDTFDEVAATFDRHATTPRQVAAFENVLLETTEANPALDVFDTRLQSFATSDGPQVADDAYEYAERGDFVSPVSILANDRGHGLTFVDVVVTSAGGAPVFLNPDGTFEWTPKNMETLPLPGETVTDKFVYTVVDALGRQAQGEVSIMWTAPLAMNYLFVTDEATVLNVSAADGVLSQDNGRQVVGTASTLPITAFDATSELGAAVTVKADGSFTYDPTGSAQLQALRIDDLGVFDSFQVYTGWTTHGHCECVRKSIVQRPGRRVHRFG